MSNIPKTGEYATNPLRPEPARVLEVVKETSNIKSLRIAFDDPQIMSNFSFLPGQIGLMSVLGVGESTFAISSPPSQREYIQFSIMKAGLVTSAIHELDQGDKVALRAPMGCAFPTEEWKGRNILIVAGGIGMAPLRSLFMHLLDNRGDYSDIKLIYGARSPEDLCFSEDLLDWKSRDGVDFMATVDTAHTDWSGRVGLVPHVLEEESPSPDNAVAITCGPPIMIKYALASLDKIGFREEQIYTTLERRMKCGIGLCGRCNIGARYVCTDGPVFSLRELKEMPDEL